MRKLLLSSISLSIFCFLFSASTIFAQNKVDFAGDWEGKISTLPFNLKIWEAQNQWNATIYIQGNTENLEVLGWKETTLNGKPFKLLYLFRPADVACISVFFENRAMTFSYFEKDNVRKVILEKQTPNSRN
jgi:hypothetical protein